ncbi:hypothetical protein L1049_024680 [Liquidambar formosana]|uniref:Uncharacterized protein n=1 Tax=Liquidambar formosana TaxID=63359 RepID=A0AAP0RVJ1_LIQFO
MLGATQYDILAACVVLFVPIGMAGWHLSRNKMLFFSGALFITLAVASISLLLSDASDLLNGSWVVIVGDSQARFVALSLLNLVLHSDDLESVKADLFKRHSDYQMVIPEIGMKLDFIWAPYVTNLTDLMMEFK